MQRKQGGESGNGRGATSCPSFFANLKLMTSLSGDFVRSGDFLRSDILVQCLDVDIICKISAEV